MRNKVSPRMTRPVSNIADALRPLLWLNRILGLAVFEMPPGRPWLKLSILYALVRSAAYGVLLWYTILYVPVQEHETIPILAVVFQVILYVNIVIAAISTVLGLFNYQKIKGFLKKIELADETLEIFGIDPEYTLAFKENMRIVIAWCCGGIIIFSSDFVISSSVFKDLLSAFSRVLTFEVPLLLNSIVELNFAVKISLLGKRFERLNALIQSITVTPLQTVHSNSCNKYQNILKKNQSKVAVKPNYYYKNRNNVELLLRTARQLHLDLCATSREVNDTCSKQMSLQMAATFLLLTGFCYCFYVVYNDTSIELAKKVQHYATLGIWIIVNIIRMIHVVRISVNVTAEAQKTSQIAHEIQVSRTQNKLIDEIHQLSLQIMQHPLCFTASGLIVLDFGFVRGFVGSVTTYLMILIQNQPDMIKAANTLADTSSENSNHNTTISSVQ